jgi:putative peptidoglycan lipid II flippase
MGQTVYRKIGLATSIMMASIFLSRVIGVLRESTIAAVGGADLTVDAYKVAFVLPEILNHIMASGFLSITFIPIFSRYLAAEDEIGGWHIFSAILTVFGLFLALLIVAAMAFTPLLVPLLAPGRSDPMFLAAAARMTRIVLPAQLFFFAGSMLMAVQFAKERFFIPALAPLIYNLAIIAGGIMFKDQWKMEGFSWGALSGAFIGSFALQAIGAHKAGMRFRFRFDCKHPDLRRYALLTLPLMVGLTMTFSTELFSKLFGSFLPAGAISWIDYAWRIVMMLVAFFGQAVGVASYPFLARLAAENRLDEMNRLFNSTLRYLSLVIPVSALVWVLRHEIVRILFQRLEFTPSDTLMTAQALSAMLIGAVAFTAQTVVNRGFYALQNTLTPAVFGTIAVVLSLPLFWFGSKLLGVWGVGLAISLSAIAQVLVLYSVWNHRSNNSGAGRVYRHYLKVVLLTLPLGGLLKIAHAVLINWIGPESLIGSICVTVALCLLFFLISALLTWLFKIEEARVLFGRLSGRQPKIAA